MTTNYQMPTYNIDETDLKAREAFKDGATFIIAAIKQGMIKI